MPDTVGTMERRANKTQSLLGGGVGGQGQTKRQL